METGRVFEDVIAESSRTGACAAWCVEDRKGHRSSNLCSFTDQMLEQLAVLRNLLVNEVYLLPKRFDEKMARFQLSVLVQCLADARAGKCVVHKLMDARCSFCGVPG